jgi:hypothetical protein
MRDGTLMTRRFSESAIVSLDAYEAFLGDFVSAIDMTASDANGAGALQLNALGCLDGEALPSTCNRYTVIFSAILGGNCCPPLGAGGLGRELLVFAVESSADGSQVEITSTATGIIEPGEAATIFDTGGMISGLGHIYPLP